jgi:hypothetical protein
MTYGLLGLNDTKSTFMDFNLESPSLNITVSTNGYADTQLFDWVAVYTGGLPPGVPHAWDHGYDYYYYSTTNETFDRATLKTKGSCQPTQTYKWGFSFLLLFICLILLSVWSIGTYILWLKAHFLLLTHGEPPIVGEYEAVIEMAAAMNKEFDKHDENLEFLRERQITGKIKHVMNGGTMLYNSPAQEKDVSFWNGFRQWARKEKWWWWSAYVLSLSLSIVGVCIPSRVLLIASFLLVVGVTVARTVGQTGKSRCLIVLIFLILGITSSEVALAIGM